MNVGDVMTEKVITVTPETTVAEAAQLLLQHRISGLPVVDPGGEVVGIVTEGDLLRRSETNTARHHARWLEFLITPGRLAREYSDANGRKVGEVMTAGVLAVAPHDPLDAAVRLMERRRVKRLPVVEGGRLVGIISRANLVRALLSNLPPASGAAVGDAELEQRIATEIATQPWGPRASVDVRVVSGVAELHGSITDDRERTALRVLVENTPGVKAVRDRLVWVEPITGMVIPPEGEGPEPAAE
jgi:CBS domain-containing protein